MLKLFITPADWSLFYTLLAQLWRSGCTPAQCLEQLVRSSDTTALKRQLQRIRLSSPDSLQHLLAHAPFSLDAVTLNLFAAAPDRQQQAEILQIVAQRFSQKMWLDKATGFLLFWPFIYYLVSSLVFSITALFVLPAFSEVYRSFGTDLPAATSFITEYGGSASSILSLGFMLYLLVLFRPRALRPLTDPILAALPAGDIATGRFLCSLAHVLNHHRSLGFDQALLLAIPAADNGIVEERLHQALGSSSPSPQQLQNVRLIPAWFSGALAVAWSTNSQTVVLTELREVATDKLLRTALRASNALNLICRVLVIVLVAWLMMALYLPIFQFGSII